MKENITVIIADDHPIFRKGLRDVLREDPAIQLVGEAADGATALQQIRELKQRAAVLDLDMTQMNGMEIAKKICQLKLPVSLVILTMHKGERIFNEAINAGVLGYVLKENAASELLNCIHAVVAGQ